MRFVDAEETPISFIMAQAQNTASVTKMDPTLNVSPFLQACGRGWALGDD